MRLASVAVAITSLGFSCCAASFTTSGDMATTYRAVLNEVKKEGFTVESASPDAGIKTAIVVTGHYHQTGSFLNIQFVSDGASQTTVNVSVMEAKRYKALQTEPWGTPHANEAKSEQEAQAIKKGLGL